MRPKKGMQIIATLILLLGTLLTPITGLSKVVHADSTSPTTTEPVEMFNLETANARVYQNADGTLTSKVYFAPVNYKDANGRYQHIDTNLVSDGTNQFSNLKNGFQTHFSSSATSSDLETVDYRDKQVSFSIAPDTLGQTLDTNAFTHLNNSTGSSDQNQLTFKNVYPDVDFKEQVTSLGVKEVLVLNKFTPGLHTFVFTLNTKGVTAKQDSDGSIVFVDDAGKTVFMIPKGVMQDSNVDPHSGDSAQSTNVTYTLKQVAGKTLLGVTLDENWLQDPSRVYPVYVDPSFTIQSQITDANISSAYPTTNYSGTSALYNSALGDYDLKSGNYDTTTGDNWAYFKLPTADQLPLLGLKVTSASFNAYCDWSYYVSTAEPTYLWPVTSSSWSPSTITWNTRPSHAASSLSSANVYRGQWAQFDITSLAQDWTNILTGDSHTYSPEEGFFLDESGQGQPYWHKYVAMENGTNQPYITINYAAPSAPWGSIYTHSDQTSGYVNLWWEPTDGATSYNVELYDGHQYETYSVTPDNGNTTTQEWTSKDKKIWPTSSEITSGVWNLHHDGNGVELPLDPSPVYKNAYNVNGGTDYSNRKNFWFRISVVKGGQVSNISDPYEPIMQPYNPDEGEAPTMVPLKIGEADAATGNFVLQDSDLSTTGYGPQVEVNRTYNQNEASKAGPFGVGWTFGYQTAIIPGTNSSNSVQLLQSDGSLSTFYTQPFTNTYISPVGEQDMTLQSITGGYELTLPDNTVEDFTTSLNDSLGQRSALTTIKDQDKNTLTLTYGSSQVNGVYPLTTIQDQSGRKTTLTENSQGLITTITDPANNQWTYGYDSGNHLITVTDEQGNTTHYDYSNSQLSSVTDPNGNSYTITYDTSGRVSGEADPAQKSQSIAYGTSTATLTDPDGIQTQWTYDIDHLKSKEVVDPTGLNQVTSDTYNEFGQPTTETDPKGKTTTYAYDKFGHLTQTTDPNGQSTTYTFGNSSLGQVTHDVTSVKSIGTTKYGYNDNHDQTVNQQPQGEKMDTSYNSNGTVGAQVTAPPDNTLSNNSFEDVWNGGLPSYWAVWSSSGSTYTSFQSTRSFFGASSWGLKNATGTVAVYPTIPSPSGFTPVDKQNGLSFSVMAYATSASAANSTYAKIDFFDSNGTKIGQINGPTLGVTGKWEELSVSVDPTQIPSGATQARPGVRSIPGTDEVDLDTADFSSSSQLVSDYNAFTNGSFKNGITNWIGVGSGTLAAATDNVLQGDSNSGKMTTSSAGATGMVPNDSNNYIPYVPGQVYHFGGFFKGNTVGGTYFELNFRDSNKATLGHLFGVTYSGTFDWTSSDVVLDGSTSVPSGTAYIQPEIFTSSGAGGSVWTDDLYLTLSPETTSMGYDSTGNLTSSTNPLGEQTKSTYNSAGDETTSTDANGNQTSMTYDKDHQQLSQTLPGGIAQIQSTYDANGNPTQETVTSGDGNTTYETTKSHYNALNQLDSSTDALNRVTTYDYDVDGRMTTTTLPDGHKITIGYDHAGNATTLSIDGTEATSTTYDANNNVSSLTAGGVTTSFTRDNNGNMTNQTDKVGAQTFGYNADNAQISHSFTIGSTTSTETDNRNNENQLVSILNGNTTLATYGYNQANQVDTVTLGNGLNGMYRYDGDHRIQSIIINSLSGVLMANGYQYDKNGNITSITDLQTNKTINSYQYDSLNQLKQETQADGTVVSYTYDALGNILTKSVTQNGTTTTTSYTYDTANELTSVNGQSYTYDVNGNLTNDGKYSYKWNELGELTEVDDASTGSAVATYTYDGQNRRASETVNGTTTQFFYEGDTNLVSYETDGSGNLTQSYTYNDQNQPVTMTTWSGSTGTTYYYHLNGHGDVIAITDSNGNTVAQYTYDAWGNILSSTGSKASTNPYRFAGYRWDSSVGMYYLNARYYNPTTMRFLSEDPVNGVNLYVYADDNPINKVDPDGNSSILARLVAANAFDWLPGLDVVIFAADIGVGAWYLGENIDWGHIKEEHGSKSNKRMPNGNPKSKFNSNRTLKRTTRATGRTKSVGKTRYNRDVYVKEFDRPVGTNTRGEPTKRVKVIKEPWGDIVTSYPY